MEEVETSGVNYENACRLCLSTTEDTQPIFLSGSEEQTGSPLLAEKIQECVSVEINESDGLSTQICLKCKKNVNNWHIFKRLCNYSQTKLRGWANGDTTEDGEIKDELSQDEKDDIVIDASYPEVQLLEKEAETKLQPEGPPILASLGLAPKNEKRNIDPRADWDRVLAIRDIIDKDEDVQVSDEETQLEDHMDVSEVDSDSDQELEYCDSLDMLPQDTAYKSKDGYVRWFKRPMKSPAESDKRKYIPGPTDASKHAKTPEHVWNCLVSREMLEGIVHHTNEYIREKFPGMIGDLTENLTSVTELKSLIGLLYMCGIMRPSFYSTSELWWADGCGLSAVSATMSFERFKFLLRCLHFGSANEDDCNDDHPLGNMAWLIEEFTKNCKGCYNIGDSAIVDEAIIHFDGPWPFRKSLKSKNYKKDGIKMNWLVDTETFYVGNLQISTEAKMKTEAVKIRNAGDVALNVVNHLSGSGITVVTPARFTSLRLAKNLKETSGLSLVGAMHSNRSEVPITFRNRNNKNYKSLFGFTSAGEALISYTHPRRKACVVLTTRPDHYNVKKMINVGGSPDAVVWYKQRRNTSKVVQTLMGAYTTYKKSSRWDMAVFFAILDIAAINAQVIWISNNTFMENVQRRNFLRSLSLQLVAEQVKLMSLDQAMDLDPLLALKGNPKKSFDPVNAVLRKITRCKFCPRRSDRKTRTYCSGCSIAVCRDHLKIFCFVCSSKI